MLKDVSIIIPIAPDETAHEKLIETLGTTEAEIIISSESTRAKSLNAGAAIAKHNTLCFLHADTQLDQSAINALQNLDQTAVNYFGLSYGGGIAELNAIGANIRSKLFGLPYGDQGFILTKDLFNQIGSFPENTPYGEDLLFIRKAKKAGIKLNPLVAKIISSPRQYKKVGWLKLTLYRQAQLFKLIRAKL